MMNYSVVAHHSKRTVFAPQPTGILPSQHLIAPVISVELAENEDVQWTWTTLPNGQQYVSGYTVVKKD
ncbi:MAG: hypothetical protein ACFB4I_20880 [Cyanophyceae cyanobacterium]